MASNTRHFSSFKLSLIRALLNFSIKGFFDWNKKNKFHAYSLWETVNQKLIL